jgi:hypothetical protein
VAVSRPPSSSSTTRASDRAPDPLKAPHAGGSPKPGEPPAVLSALPAATSRRSSCCCVSWLSGLGWPVALVRMGWVERVHAGLGRSVGSGRVRCERTGSASGVAGAGFAVGVRRNTPAGLAFLLSTGAPRSALDRIGSVAGRGEGLVVSRVLSVTSDRVISVRSARTRLPSPHRVVRHARS